MSAVNRYRFTNKTVDDAKAFLRGTSKKEPSFLKIYKGEVKKNRLILDGRQVVPDEKVDAYLRRRIYDGKTPLSRDAAFYLISKSVINISRKKIDHFLKRQNVIRETDNQQPTSKRGSRKVTKKGQLHLDLIELKFKDLPFVVDEMPSKKMAGDEALMKGYVLTLVDALTSLAYFRFHPHKTQVEVTPIVKAALEWFSEKLETPIERFVIFSDRGSEFAFKTFESWGARTVQLKRSSVVEAKNSHFQRVLFRIAKLKKRTNLKKLVRDAMAITNRTQSSLTKQTPLENIKEKQSDVATKYNRKRGKDSGIKVRARPLVVGETVRYQLLGEKDKSVGYKAYKAVLWSKKSYKVQAKRGNRYKIRGRFFHRDQLRITPPSDPKSEALLALRQEERNQKIKAEIKKVRRELDKAMKSKRPKAKEAVQKIRTQLDFWRKFDQEYGT